MNPKPKPTHQRRRLWQLPTQAHEILLAMSFTPEQLRVVVARTLGQLHHARCDLAGRDVDVLYSVVHDLGTRSVLSEALHKRLDQRHALALPRWRALRSVDVLQTAWRAAREAPGLCGDLWALLTHAQGQVLQQEALYDARAWLFHHARCHLADSGSSRAWQQRCEASDAALQASRERAVQQQQAADIALQQLRAQLASTLGEAARWREQAQALPAAAPAAHAAAPPAPRSEPARVFAPAQAVAPAATPNAPAPAPKPEPIAGRQVLCVGGMRHAVARYRSRIERLGARFEHHDGGIEDGVQGLEGRLQRADLVLCQAGCINHEAYHRIKRHCERTGKPCLYLQRPSLAQLDRALAPWATPQVHLETGATHV